MTAAWWAVTVAVIAVILVVAFQIWARSSDTLGPLLPLLIGLGLGCVAGLLGVVGLIQSTRVGDRRETALSTTASWSAWPA